MLWQRLEPTRMASLQNLGYLPMSLATLHEAAIFNFNLYVQRPGRAYAELYRERNYPLRDEDLRRLRAGGVDHLYIRFEDAEAFKQYLHDHVLNETGLPTPI